MDTGTVSQQVARKVDVPRARSLLPCVTIRDRLSFSRSADLSAVFSALPSFPFSRKINRAGGRCNGELTSVDSEQKDRTHPMNNGSSVAHYTGEGSRAVLYVKTWTVERDQVAVVGLSRLVCAAKALQVLRREGRLASA